VKQLFIHVAFLSHAHVYHVSFFSWRLSHICCAGPVLGEKPGRNAYKSWRVCWYARYGKINVFSPICEVAIEIIKTKLKYIKYINAY